MIIICLVCPKFSCVNSMLYLIKVIILILLMAVIGKPELMILK